MLSDNSGGLIAFYDSNDLIISELFLLNLACFHDLRRSLIHLGSVVNCVLYAGWLAF